MVFLILKILELFTRRVSEMFVLLLLLLLLTLFNVEIKILANIQK